MVVGLILYQFNLNIDDSGEISPEFRHIHTEIAHEYHSQMEEIDTFISENDKYSIFFSLTTGVSQRDRKEAIQTQISGRLKDKPLKYLSNYFQNAQELRFLLIALFEPDSEVELFDQPFFTMMERIRNITVDLSEERLRSYQFAKEVEHNIENEMQYGLFLIERLSNLSKLQKVGLIFHNFERMESLRILREGPISRKNMIQKIQEIRKDPNIDVILKPFVDLNFLRRDWFRGEMDRKTGELKGQGEYLFLIKDVILIRTPPKELVANIKEGGYVWDDYNKALIEFYSKYDPMADPFKEGELLSKFLLDPDIFDLYALLRVKSFPVKKLPRVISNFSDIDTILKKLQDVELLKIIPDEHENQWVCLLAEITPVVIFPEYLLSKISDRTTIKEGMISQDSMVAPISKEVAILALELLEATQNDVIEF